MSSRLFPGTPQIASSSAKHYFCQARLQLHPLQLRVTLLPCFPVNLLNFLLYLPLYTSLYIPNFSSSIMEPMASQVRNHYSQKNQEAHLERALAHALVNTADHHCRSNVWPSNPAFEYSIGDSYCSGNYSDEAGWSRYRSGDQQWRKWRPWRVHLVIQYRRRWFGQLAWGPTSRPAAP